MDHKTHAFPMLAHIKKWVPTHTLLSFLSHFHPVRSSSPLLFILSLPSSPVPLSSYFVFSWFSAWPHLWRRIITKWGHHVLTGILRSATRSRLLVFFVLDCKSCQCSCSPPPWLSLSLFDPMHTLVHTETALGVITVISHCRTSWQGTLWTLCLRTLCPCSARS